MDKNHSGVVNNLENINCCASNKISLPSINSNDEMKTLNNSNMNSENQTVSIKSNTLENENFSKNSKEESIMKDNIIETKQCEAENNFSNDNSKNNKESFNNDLCENNLDELSVKNNSEKLKNSSEKIENNSEKIESSSENIENNLEKIENNSEKIENNLEIVSKKNENSETKDLENPNVKEKIKFSNSDKSLSKETNFNDSKNSIDLKNCSANDFQDNQEGNNGFPKCFLGWVKIGETLPINKKTWNELDIDGNDAILDCVSQVVPLMLKKPNIFPDKIDDTQNDNKKSIDKTDSDKSEEIKSQDKKEISLIDKPATNNNSMLMLPDYYKSSVGVFLLGIGLSRCKEWSHKDSIRQTQKLIKKEGEKEEHLEELKKQTLIYNECKGANSIFNFKTLKCSICDFKTESELTMQGHLSTPHLSNRKEFKCNFCVFITRDVRTIMYHFQQQHKKYCTVQLPPHLYECPTCNYESNQKAKAANHIAKCSKIFSQDKIQQTLDLESEYPAITPKPITQDYINLYETTMQALRPVVMNPSIQIPFIPGLPKALQQQMLLMQQQQLSHQKQKSIKSNSNMRNQNSTNLKQLQQNTLSNFIQNLNSNALNNLGLNNPSLLNNLSFAKSAPQLFQMLQGGSHQQIIPKNVSVPSTSNLNKNFNLPKANFKGPLPNKPTSSKDIVGNKTGNFVICEICDGYIKDLDQLRTHMQWSHKVKIHPKMLASRPPLNCQKCQWRFFTDQGLERHLLGAHGLVTTNMQELVDRSQDSGRCTICGKVFTNKLVDHMNQNHKITLRPAHLSYKCTVCSATFNLYRLFENHVYMVHSVKDNNVKRGNETEPSSSKKIKTSQNEFRETNIGSIANS